MGDSAFLPADAESDDGEVLFAPADIPRGGPGEAARLLEQSVASARESHKLTDVDLALIGAARVGAYALDQARSGSGPKVAYAVAAVLTPYREVLESLGLAPERVETPTASGAAEFLAGLAHPTPPTP